MEPRSQSNSKALSCWSCKGPLKEAEPFCTKCKTLQDLPQSDLSHFLVLGVPESLLLTEETLRNRFYQLSKNTHPDKYASAKGNESQFALRWSTAINKAYQVLKDRGSRSAYLLNLYKVGESRNTQVPVDLAETYFALQDLLMEDEGHEKIGAFRKDLHTQIDLLDVEWQAIATDWDKANEKGPVLQKLQNNLNKQRYLNSMLADLDRKLGKTADDHWN